MSRRARCAADVAPGATRAGADASQERESRRACAQPLPAAAGRASVQQGRPPLARSTRAAARRAPDARGLPAPDRFPRQRDRLARAGAGEQALGSPEIQRLMTVPGVNMNHGGDVRGERGRYRPLLLAAQARQLSRARSEGARIGQRAGPPRPDLEGGRGRGQARARRGRLEGLADAGTAARLLRACSRSSRRAGCRDRERAQAGGAVLASAHPRAGLCVPAPLDDAQQDPPARAARRRPAAQGQGGRRRRQVEEALDAERELSRQAEASYRRLTADWRATGPAKKVGARATQGRASSRPSKRQAAQQTRSSPGTYYAPSVTRTNAHHRRRHPPSRPPTYIRRS